MGIIDAARQAKHLGFVAQKRARKTAIRGWDAYLTQRAARTGYEFSVDAHRNYDGGLPRQYFLHRTSPIDGYVPTEPPQRVFCFWTGDGDLTPGRQRGLAAMRELCGWPVELVTPDNLDDWIVQGHPLHPAYVHLSLVHRADYLRAYFMAHHGGGYSDIKGPTAPWAPAFRHLDDPECWVVGYPERSSRSCGGDIHTGLGKDIRRNFSRLVGMGAFIMRPGTPFAWEWLREAERRLDYYRDHLTEHPGGTWGKEPYPIGWITLCSDIAHPLQLKYLRHVRQDVALLPHLEGHR